MSDGIFLPSVVYLMSLRTFWPSSNNVHENTELDSIRNVLKVLKFLMFPNRSFHCRSTKKVSYVGVAVCVDIPRIVFSNYVFEIRHATGDSYSPFGEPTNRVFGSNVSSFRVESHLPKTSERPIYSENFQVTLLFFHSLNSRTFNEIFLDFRCISISA